MILPGKSILPLLVALATSLAPLPADATDLVVSSYTMSNGDAGTHNYRDFTYFPCPANSCNTNNALLTGGTGKLTDGVLPAASWYLDGVSSQWVGWETSQNGYAPTIRFFFSDTATISAVRLWVDNTPPGNGPVLLPASVAINGVTYAVQPDPSPGPRWLVFPGLTIVGNSVDVQLIQAPGYQTFLMLGQVAFEGSLRADRQPGCAGADRRRGSGTGDSPPSGSSSEDLGQTDCAQPLPTLRTPFASK